MDAGPSASAQAGKPDAPVRLTVPGGGASSRQSEFMGLLGEVPDRDSFGSLVAGP